MLYLLRRNMPARLPFDVTGLMAWYAFYRTPTGIQRVIEQILMALAIAGDNRVVHVAGFPGARELFVIDRDAIHGLANERTNADTIRRQRRACVEIVKRGRLLASLGLKAPQDPECWPPPDAYYAPPARLGRADGRDAFVNFGGFRWYKGQSRNGLKAQHQYRPRPRAAGGPGRRPASSSCK
jgi:hypothetical protein